MGLSGLKTRNSEVPFSSVGPRKSEPGLVIFGPMPPRGMASPGRIKRDAVVLAISENSVAKRWVVNVRETINMLFCHYSSLKLKNLAISKL